MFQGGGVSLNCVYIRVCHFPSIYSIKAIFPEHENPMFWSHRALLQRKPDFTICFIFFLQKTIIPLILPTKTSWRQNNLYKSNLPTKLFFCMLQEKKIKAFNLYWKNIKKHQNWEEGGVWSHKKHSLIIECSLKPLMQIMARKIFLLKCILAKKKSALVCSIRKGCKQLVYPSNPTDPIFNADPSPNNFFKYFGIK